MEFQVDCDTVQEAKALMASAGLCRQSVGVDYDPDALLAA